MSLRRSRRFSLAAAATALAVAATAATTAGCTDEPDGPSGPAATSSVTRLEIPQLARRQIDLLFVIDNSPAMAPQRARMLESYRRLMAALEAYPDGLLDLHIGVVTTDLGTRAPGEIGPGRSVGTGPGSCSADGDRGELRRVSGIDGNFIADTVLPDGTRARNYSGSLADAFAQLADVGSAGCTYARPLEALRRALENPANEGFIRPNAPLAIVLLTNDEDCSFGSSLFIEDTLDRSRCTTEAGSLMPVAEYTSFLSSFPAKTPGRVAVLAAFAPPGAPACTDVRPSARLASFVSSYQGRTRTVSICEPDPSELVAHPIFAMTVLLGSSCFSAPLLDTDPATDGLQAECAAWYSYNDNDGVPTEKIIPACRGGAPGPCWEIVLDPLNCTAGEDTVMFRNPHIFGVGADARAFIECVAAP